MHLRVAARWLEAKYDPYAPKSPQEVLDTHLYTVRPDDSDEMNLDVRGEASAKAGLLKRARAWPVDRFIEHMERYAAVERIAELRGSLAEKPLQYRVLVNGRAKDKGYTSEALLPQLRERLADFYRHEKWADRWELEVKPRPKSDYRKLDALVAAREERERAWAALHRSLNTRAPTFETETKSGNISIMMFDHGVAVGGIVVSYVERSDDTSPTSGGCWSDVRALADRFGEGSVWTVPKATMWPEYRGQGLGHGLYRQAIEALDHHGGKPIFLEAHECLRNEYGSFGSTSDDAKRVWKKLVAQYPSSGTVIAIV